VPSRHAAALARPGGQLALELRRFEDDSMALGAASAPSSHRSV